MGDREDMRAKIEALEGTITVLKWRCAQKDAIITAIIAAPLGSPNCESICTKEIAGSKTNGRGCSHRCLKKWL